MYDPKHVHHVRHPHRPTLVVGTPTPPMIDLTPLFADPFEAAAAEFVRQHDAAMKQVADQIAGVFGGVVTAARDALDRAFTFDFPDVSAGLRREIAAQAEATRALRDANVLTPAAD